MGLSLSNVEVPKSYIRNAGVIAGVKLVDLKYDATSDFEYFDIELQRVVDGAIHRQRVFIPTQEKVFPKKKYEKGVEVGMETPTEALERVKKETLGVLKQLAICYVTDKEIDAIEAPTWKELINKAGKIINLSDKRDSLLNFILIWKNNDNKQQSNLTIPVPGKWVEAAIEGQTPTLRLSTYQQNNFMVAKYTGAPEAPAADASISGEGTSDLPF